MKKKQRTLKQKKNHYRRLQYASKAGQYVAVATPFVVMGGINFNEWFMIEDGWKIGLGGTLALGLMSIAVTLVSKNKEKTSTISTYITMILTWIAVAFILTLLSQIIQEVANLMFISASGLAGALGLEISRTKCQEKADRCKRNLEKASDDLDVEQAKEEIQEENAKKTVRF